VEQTPTAGQLLAVWEEGRSQTPLQRAFSLLALAAPDCSAEELARYSIGRRDRALLGLRERLFGVRFAAVAVCPACAQEIELDFTTADISSAPVAETNEFHSLQLDGYALNFRLPTCEDLASLTPNASAREGRSQLLQRCVTATRPTGQPSLLAALPENVIAAVSERMAQLDPQGDIQLTLTCPKCGQKWLSPLDIASYLWREICAWAGRTVNEIHLIASAYGWRETDILALSPQRRRTYLELIES
jgi:hypothetical protein